MHCVLEQLEEGMPCVYIGLSKHKLSFREHGESWLLFSTSFFVLCHAAKVKLEGGAAKEDSHIRRWCSPGLFFDCVGKYVVSLSGQICWRSERLPVFSIPAEPLIWSLDVWLHKCTRREAWCWKRSPQNLCTVTILWKEGILTWKLLQSAAEKETAW